jgi:hypothetical protein
MQSLWTIGLLDTKGHEATCAAVFVRARSAFDTELLLIETQTSKLLNVSMTEHVHTARVG